VFSRIIDDHLRLEMPTILDAPELLDVVERNRADLETWLTWPHAVTDVESAEAWLTRDLHDWADLTRLVTLIRLDDAIVGGVHVHHLDRRAGVCELGYWLDAAHRGHGIMTAAVGEVHRLRFGELCLRRVSIHCDTRNERSIALASRLGYTFEGVLRHQLADPDGTPHDEAVYSLLREEWRATQGASPTR